MGEIAIATSHSVALIGLDGTVVEIEVAHGGGTPRTIMVGNVDKAISEARDRVRPAMLSNGLGWGNQLITINLTPATLPKTGSHYDLGIAAAVLAVLGSAKAETLGSTVFLGELGLDGRVHRVPGILPALLAASDAGFERAIVPMSQTSEALLVQGMTVWGVDTILDLRSVLTGEPVTQRPPDPEPDARMGAPGHKDMIDVIGQPDAKWALEVAAAGRHHLYMHGAPGVGKTMLAERLPSLLPDLNPSEAVEVSAIHSLAGADLNGGLMTRPPYADPHHTSSVASLVGGGAKVVRPGSISLAHRGVLFLDEAPEFSSQKLESLRTPLEAGWVSIGRAAVHARYPARFQLIAAANPCPCGLAGMPGQPCTCSPWEVRRYGERISGPILDRIDLHQRLVPMRKAFLKLAVHACEPSSAIAARVAEARQRQARRLAGTGWLTNGEVPGPFLRRELPPASGTDVIDDAVIRGTLSSRGVDKVLRVAWTLADLAGHERVDASEIRAAMAMRQGERR